MKKVGGYIISGVGLAIMLVGFGTFKIDAAIFDIIKPGMITTIGVVAIIIGVAIAMMDKEKHGKQKDKEVPIYEGEEIVGYRRHKK